MNWLLQLARNIYAAVDWLFTDAGGAWNDWDTILRDPAPTLSVAEQDAEDLERWLRGLDRDLAPLYGGDA